MAMDVFEGWHGKSLNGNAKPNSTAGIVAGMFVKYDAQDELVLATGATDELAVFALENQTDHAVIGAAKMAFIKRNAVMLTDQYATGETYVSGSKLRINPAAHGKLTLHAGGAEPVVAEVAGPITILRDETTYLKIVF